MSKLTASVQQDIQISTPLSIDPRIFWEIMVIMPPLSDERIKAQQGAFIASCGVKDFMPIKEPTDNWTRPKCLSHQIRIQERDKAKIRRELAQLNISAETLYPSLNASVEAVIQEFFDRP